MRVSIDRDRRVRAEHAMPLPVSARTAWGQMRDWRRFLATDPLHVRIEVAGALPASGDPRGVRFVIPHRLLGIGPDRVGRVLMWREGAGYAISDLSARGRDRAFPHVCTYEVRNTGANRCDIVLGARGRWTAPWVPRWLAKAWIWWVLKATEGRVKAEFATLVSWRGRITTRS